MMRHKYYRFLVDSLYGRLFYFLLGMATLSAILTIIFSPENEHWGNAHPMLRATNRKTIDEHIAGLNFNEANIKTHKGYVKLDEINNKVFKPFGYEIIEPSLPVPTVRMMNEPKCEVVFSEWLKIAQQPQPDVPPKKFPKHQTDRFLLNGYTAMSEWYFNDHSNTGDSPRNWNRISEFLNFTKTELGALAYNKDSESMYHAMGGYRLKGKRGFVVGSMQPWVEVMALKHGAKSILTVEYNPLTIQNEFKNRQSAISPVDFVKNWNLYAETFDFAASSSSIEHSGLGRYGDPLDPIGDLREMLKIRCMLKKGGLLFLAVPFGTDAIQYNAHRIYGSIRLALMFYGFDWLGTYSGDSEQAFDLTTTLLHSVELYAIKHYTVVLRKV